jgi:hypothetical protein
MARSEAVKTVADTLGKSHDDNLGMFDVKQSMLASTYILNIDHMLAFIYLNYLMVTLLLESVSSFEEAWIECIGRWLVEEGSSGRRR